MQLATGAIIGYADADYKVPIEEFDKIEPLLKNFDSSSAPGGSTALLSNGLNLCIDVWGPAALRIFMHIVVGFAGR